MLGLKLIHVSKRDPDSLRMQAINSDDFEFQACP